MAKREKKQSFEDKLRELEEIARKLDDPSFSLESSLELFEQGVRLGKELRVELEAAKLKVRKLMEDGSLQPFDPPRKEGRSGEDSD